MKTIQSKIEANKAFGSFGSFRKEPPKPAFDFEELSRLVEESDGSAGYSMISPEAVESMVQGVIDDVDSSRNDAPEDLFEPERKLSDEEAAAVIAQTVAALTNANRAPVQDNPADVLRKEIDSQIVKTLVEGAKPSKSELRDKWIASLPESARRALNNLRLMYGALTLDEMFHSTTPERMKLLVEEILMLDLTRIWKSYHQI